VRSCSPESAVGSIWGAGRGPARRRLPGLPPRPEMSAARREWLVLAGPSQGGRKPRRGPPVTRRRRGGLCHRSPSLANSPAVDVSSNRSVRTESSPPETHDDHQQRQVSRPAKVPGTVLKEIAGERGKINLLRSFACSVFRATIHSGVRHRFEKCCMGLRRKTTHSPKSVKPITRTRTYLCGNCAARRATAAELAAVPAETTALCYPWLVKA